MKRFRLSAKLAMAIIPIGLVALLAAGFIAYTFLQESEQQGETAHAATVAADTVDALKTVWIEEGQARQLYLFGDESATDDLASAVERTDEAFDRLEGSIAELESVAGGFFFEVSESIAQDIRNVSLQLQQIRAVDNPTGTDLAGYQDVAASMLLVLPKANSIVSDRVQGRELATAYFLAEGGQVSVQQEQLIEEYRAEADPDSADPSEVAALQATLEVMEDDFGAWALRANQTANRRNAAILRYTRLPSLNIDTFPLARNEDILRTSESLAQGVADESQANAVDSETEAALVAGVAAIILLLALWGAYAVIRSVVRRVRGVTTAATQVSEVDLPNLVDALQNPKEDLAELKPTVIEAAGSDEVGELAQSFTSLHTTLIDVAGQQMDILRKGVSEIFVTLARRNRSLVDRQLALLDELESREEDAETLGGYYKLDHLATRMRRNAESLLVLAGSEPTRIWSNPLDVSEIIRAALGEVDEYQRVDIMALEPAMISGRAVADVAHLMSELLDNGTQYSSPSDRVRVAGLFDPEGYMLTVSDSGIGMSEARLDELNHLLEAPPVLGLALQPTLGMYVVARLASRHNVRVQLISGSPGLTVRVLLPKALLEAPPAKEDPLPEPVSRPAIEPTHEYRPAGATSDPVGASTNGGYSNGHATPPAEEAAAFASHEPAGSLADEAGVPPTEVATTSPAEEEDDVLEATDTPAAESGGLPEVVVDGSNVLPGSVKGKHEHPGRRKTTSAMDDGVWAPSDADGSVSDKPAFADTEPVTDSGAPTFETANETFAETEESAQSTLSKRVPGAALGAELEMPHLEEVLPPSQPLERSQDDSPWWAKEVDEPAPEPDESRTLWDDVEEQPVQKLDIPDEPPAVDESPSISDAGLPVRTPGVSFTETDDSTISSAASDSGAIGIKSALTSFASGRDLAGGKTDKQDGDSPEGKGE